MFVNYSAERGEWERERESELHVRGRDRELASEREEEWEREKAALLREIMDLEMQLASSQEVCLRCAWCVSIVCECRCEIMDLEIQLASSRGVLRVCLCVSEGRCLSLPLL